MSLFSVTVLLFVYTAQLSLGFRLAHQPVRQEEHATSIDYKTNDSCSPWKYNKYDNSSCVCGESIHDIVVYSDDQPTVSLLTCHCMSYSDNGEEILVGNCPYLCTDTFHIEIRDNADVSELCKQNRQGQN